MTFKPGESGNPTGRPAGSPNKRAQLAKLLEPHAEALVNRMVELALNGDVNALRLCIERLIPKIQREPIDINLPEELDKKGLPEIERAVLQAVLSGQVNIDDAKRLIEMISVQSSRLDFLF